MAETQESHPFRGFLIVLALIGACFGLLFWNNHGDRGPDLVIREQLKALQNKKLTEAYYAYTSKEFQAATSLEQFKNFIRAYPLLEREASLELKTINEKNNLKTIDLTLNKGEPDTISFQIEIIKEEESWKVLNIKVIDKGISERLSDPVFNEILTFIEATLKLIQQRELDTAYNEKMSTDFKSKTKLDSFKDFIINYPILSTYTHLELANLSSTEDLAIAKVHFSNAKQSAEVDFTLTYNEKGWKIQGMRVIDQEQTDGSPSNFSQEEIRAPLLAMLKLIREGKINEAYDEYASRAFQESTSKEQFLEFVKSNKFLKQALSVDWGRLTFNNNIAIQTLFLKMTGVAAQQAEFSLIREDNQWKVVQIQLFEQETSK